MIVTPGARRGVLALVVAIAAELASPAAEVGGGARVAPLQGELSTRDRALEAASSRNWPEAARQYRLAVEADPDSTSLRLDLGAALESVGDARGALAQYREALRLDSKLARADYRLGALLERAGRDQEAIEHYTAAVTQDRTSAQPISSWPTCYAAPIGSSSRSPITGGSLSWNQPPGGGPSPDPRQRTRGSERRWRSCV